MSTKPNKNTKTARDREFVRHSGDNGRSQKTAAQTKQNSSLNRLNLTRKPQHHNYPKTASSVTNELQLTSSRNHKLSAVFDFININSYRFISLKDVAKALGYSDSYLARFVKSKTGKTVNFWIVQQRMKSAEELLKKSDRSVEQIATELGYRSTNLFFRDFRRHHHTTPLVWRKEQSQTNSQI